MIVMGILGGGKDHQRIIVVNVSGSGIRLQITVLDMTGSVGLFNDRGTPLKGCFDITFYDFAGEQQIAFLMDFRRPGSQGFMRAKHRRQFRIGHLDGV